MIEVGQFNTLKVVKQVPFGLYFDGGSFGEILLPNKVVPKDTQLNDFIKAFIYYDSEDKIIATTKEPKAILGTFASLKVIDINRVGAFLDWGLDKDLLVPVPEQQRPMEKGKSYIVYLKLDNKERIIATSKLDHCLERKPENLQVGDEVDLLIADRTDLGIKVIINNRNWGLIHSSDNFQNLHYGEKTQGYIKTLREDGKCDVTLRKMGRDSITELAQSIINELIKRQGFLALHDKSSPQEIQAIFHQSKKSFKNAIGQLYKQGKITIEENGIQLNINP